MFLVYVGPSHRQPNTLSLYFNTLTMTVFESRKWLIWICQKTHGLKSFRTWLPKWVVLLRVFLTSKPWSFKQLSVSALPCQILKMWLIYGIACVCCTVFYLVPMLFSSYFVYCFYLSDAPPSYQTFHIFRIFIVVSFWVRGWRWVVLCLMQVLLDRFTCDFF